MITTRLLLNLYFIPLMFFIGAIFIQEIFNSTIGELALLGKSIDYKIDILPYASVVVLIWLIFNIIRLIRFMQGKNNRYCQKCCGILAIFEKNGRYGPYAQCLSCGKNNSLKY